MQHFVRIALVNFMRFLLVVLGDDAGAEECEYIASEVDRKDILQLGEDSEMISIIANKL